MHLFHTTPLRSCALTMALLALACTASAQTLPIQPTSGVWDSGGGFQFDLKRKKALATRQSLSGIACAPNAQAQHVCLLAFDEGAEARFATLGDQTLQPDTERLVLRADGGELDAEAAATDGRYFYVTGSHSAKRSSCASNPNSRHVLRLRRDPATGRALRAPGGGGLVDYADTARLWAALQTEPAFAALAPHAGERACLGAEPGQQGINIEGMAVQDGRLYFGLRGPVLEGAAQVLAVDADALFSGGDLRATRTALALGQRGIRDMVAVPGGMLLLAGPDDGASHQGMGWSIWWWDTKNSTAVVTPKLLAELDLRSVQTRKCDKELKPEALTVLAENPQAYRVLVLSDGMCDGGAMAFTVPW